jgi:alpha-beta hydrolase superfamily lysophospholipase
MKILVVGASGYIGGRLASLLQARGEQLVLTSRDTRPLAARFPDTEVVAADLLDPASLPPALEGVDVAYYLAHSMGAALCLEAARQNRLPVSRLVALAPMVGLSMVERPGLARSAAAILDGLLLGSSFVPGGGETSIATKPFAGNRLTSDPERYARNADLSAARGALRRPHRRRHPDAGD